MNEKLFRIRLAELLDEKKAEGISNRKFAEESGINYVTISRWLTGKRVPNKYSIQVLANTLNVREEYLLGEDSYRTLDENDWKNFALKRQSEIKTEKDRLYSALLQYMEFKNFNSDQIKDKKHFKSYMLKKIDTAISDYFEYANHKTINYIQDNNSLMRRKYKK